MFGANGTATLDGGLLQLRALDWNVDGVCVYWNALQISLISMAIMCNTADVLN